MSNLRGQLIRLAHAHPELRPELLPLLRKETGMFASTMRQAAPTMALIDKINKMTDYNDHTGALAAVAKMVGLTKEAKILGLMGQIQDLVGSTPSPLIEYRNQLSNPIYAKAKQTKMKDKEGKETTVYALLD